MPIICFEGASAAGKSTLSDYLREKCGAFVVREVNFLFERTAAEPRFWYFEKQTERWQMALEAAKNHSLVILDGDAFQPLWYNWAYDYDFGESFREINRFYRNALAAGKINFPDKYFILTVNTGALRNRKAGDSSRTRKNFERHLRFIEPQKAYFNFIKSNRNGLVEFIENEDIELSGEKVINSLAGNVSDKDASLDLFDSIADWLENKRAADFIK
jgi:deoxyadenosine/deoxycytidine kinase